MSYKDMTFCLEKKCSFYSTCERGWTEEKAEDALKIDKNIEIWFFIGKPMCFDKGLESLNETIN